MSKKNILAIILVLIILVMIFLVFSQEKQAKEIKSLVAGNITLLDGSSNITRLKQQIQAKEGLDIDNKDIINTHDETKMQITFNDNTLVTLGSLTTFEVEEFLQDDENQKATLSIKEGAFKVITGKIGKLAPQNFTLKTKNAYIGIRGTIFTGEINHDNSNQDYIACQGGEVVVKSIKKDEVIVLKKGEMAKVKENGNIKKSKTDASIFSLLPKEKPKNTNNNTNLEDKPITPSSYIQGLIDSKAKLTYKGKFSSTYSKNQTTSMITGELKTDEVVMQLDFGTKEGKITFGELSGEVMNIDMNSPSVTPIKEQITYKINDIQMKNIKFYPSPLIFIQLEYSEENKDKVISIKGRFADNNAEGFIGSLTYMDKNNQESLALNMFVLSKQ